MEWGDPLHDPNGDFALVIPSLIPLPYEDGLLSHRKCYLVAWGLECELLFWEAPFGPLLV